MTDKNTIRVAVGAPNSLQSSIWRFWTQKNEIYVLARESAKLLKISLHSSGIWRLAYLPERDINDPLIEDNDPRVMWRWQKPKEFKQGWTQCLDVVIPAVPINGYFSIESIGEPRGILHWLDGLLLGHKQQLSLLLAESVSRNIEEVIMKDDQVIGSMSLDNGKIAWVFARKNKMSKIEQQYSEKFAEDMKISYKSDPGDVFAALMMVNKDHPYPLITNIALGWNNVYIANTRHKKGGK